MDPPCELFVEVHRTSWKDLSVFLVSLRKNSSFASKIEIRRRLHANTKHAQNMTEQEARTKKCSTQRSRVHDLMPQC
jgi:hypothetical protein